MIDLYSIAAESRTADANRFWTVFQVMSAINTGMIALSAGRLHDLLAFLPVSIVGMIVCYIWWGMQLRYAVWCLWWDEKLAEIERCYRENLTGKSHIPKELYLFDRREINVSVYAGIDSRFFSIPTKNKSKNHPPGFSTKTTPVTVAKLFFLVWFLLGIVSLMASN